MFNLIKATDLNAAFDAAHIRDAQQAQKQARKDKLTAACSALGEITGELVEVGDQKKFRSWFRTFKVYDDHIRCVRDIWGADVDRLTVTKDGQFYKVNDFKTADLDKAIQKMMPSILKSFSTEELERIQSKCADNFKYDVARKQPWYTKLIPTL